MSTLSKNEQPLQWGRAFVSGAIGSILMLAFVDTCNMMGITRFSFELYLGSLFYGDASKTLAWTLGYLLNVGLGGVFGIFYAYVFEFVSLRADSRLGTTLGLAHALLAAIAFFPFFGVIHHELGNTRFAGFGFFGSGLEPVTPIILLLGHCGFGAAMGTFYGPVRTARVRMRVFEPEENLPPGSRDAVSAEDDSEDRLAV